MELSDKERFLLHYLKNRQIKWDIDDSVKNLFPHCGSVIQDLKHAGYLIDDDYSYFLETKNMSELKNILNILSLPQNGKKGELISRIKNHTSAAERKEICSELYYVLTDKGIIEEQKYWTQKKAMDSYLKECVFRNICDGNYVKASQVMGNIYSKEIIPPGIGINWNDEVGIESRAEAELHRIRNYDFSDLDNSTDFIETLVKILYYDAMIEHNLQSSILQFMPLLTENIHCEKLDAFFKEKDYVPSESQRLFVYLDTKHYNAFQNNMKTLLKKNTYKPLPEGVFNVNDITISGWKEYQTYSLLLSKNIEGFPKTFQTYQKHKSKNSEKYQFWIAHL